MAREPVTPVVDLGLAPYEEAWTWQRRWVEGRRRGSVPDVVLVCQHPPVVTVGRSGEPGQVGPLVAKHGIPVFWVERGGGATYHGPGQWVIYPILALEGEERNLRILLWRLEEVILRTVASFDIAAGRIPGLTGAWVGCEQIGMIGIAVRRWVTYHGFALNVAVDQEPFRWIVPCGLKGYGVTSMERVLGRPVPEEAVRAALLRHFSEVFERPLQEWDKQWLYRWLSEERRGSSWKATPV